MRGPSWLAGILAALMIATAAYCASRLVIARARRRADERDVDLVHTVMGVAMAGMLVSWLNPLPDRVWAVMFSAATGWFGWRAWRGRAYLSCPCSSAKVISAPKSFRTNWASVFRTTCHLLLVTRHFFTATPSARTTA